MSRWIRIAGIATLWAALAAGSADASSWSKLSPVNPSGLVNQLNGVSCARPNACIAVGDYTSGGISANGPEVTLAERWNGVGWQLQPTPNPAGEAYATLSGVSCPTTRSCAAVGYSNDSTGAQAALAERWNGTGWHLHVIPNVPGEFFATLSGVSCTSTRFCIAVGNYSEANHTVEALTERWNGASWQRLAIPNVSAGLDSVSCTSPSACMAVGPFVAERWNGVRWTPAPGGAGVSVSCSAASACTAVNGTDAERWNGAGWQVQSIPPQPGVLASYVNAVSCPARQACSAVGEQTTTNIVFGESAAHWNGTSWQQEIGADDGTTYGDLVGVSCANATQCIAVGQQGHFARFALAWVYR